MIFSGYSQLPVLPGQVDIGASRFEGERPQDGVPGGTESLYSPQKVTHLLRAEVFPLSSLSIIRKAEERVP